MNLTFFVPGIPRPGGSKRVFPIRKGGKLTGKFIVTDAAGKGNKDWRASVAHEASQNVITSDLLGLPARLPMRIEIVFTLPRPKSHFRANGTLKPTAPAYHITKPDCLKLARSTTDALTGILYFDDSQLVIETYNKGYGPNPGAHISVSTM